MNNGDQPNNRRDGNTSPRQSHWQHNALSLAGIFHCADMVEQVAKTGYLNTQDFDTCVRSLLELEPKNIEDVYGSPQNIRRGIEVLIRALGNQHHPENADIIRYGLAILHLQKLLSRRRNINTLVGERLLAAKQQAEHFSSYTHDNVVANIAETYSDTISKFPYRIQVTGEQNYLEQTRIANQVRTMLFAGIRSASLWRHYGGRKWHLIFNRKHILRAAEELFSETQAF